MSDPQPPHLHLATDPATLAHPDLTTVRLLPYHFAKSKGIITARSVDNGIEVWLRPGVTAATLAEVRRTIGLPLQAVILETATFDACLAQVYTREDNTAEKLMGNMGDAVDLATLTQELPEITDLLETEDDAPIIRLINALLTQALKEK